MAATTWRPAFSISTSDGMPMSSMVKRSASRICAAVRMRTLRGSVTAASGTGWSADPRSDSRTFRDAGSIRWQRRSTSTAASPASATRSSRSSITASSTAKASTRRCAPTTGGSFLFDRHVRRLRRSARMIALDVPFTDEELLQRDRPRRWRRADAGRTRPTSASSSRAASASSPTIPKPRPTPPLVDHRQAAGRSAAGRVSRRRRASPSSTSSATTRAP